MWKNLIRCGIDYPSHLYISSHKEPIRKYITLIIIILFTI